MDEKSFHKIDLPFHFGSEWMKNPFIKLTYNFILGLNGWKKNPFIKLKYHWGVATTKVWLQHKSDVTKQQEMHTLASLISHLSSLSLSLTHLSRCWTLNLISFLYFLIYSSVWIAIVLCGRVLSEGRRRRRRRSSSSHRSKNLKSSHKSSLNKRSALKKKVLQNFNSCIHYKPWQHPPSPQPQNCRRNFRF